MPRRPSKPKPHRAPKPAPRRRSWHIIIIDQEPLRRTARVECQKAMSRLEKARAEWNRFESQDKPAFARWMAQEFGPLLTAARDIEAQIREKELLIHEVETEMRFGARSKRAAYERVLSERAYPSAARDDFEDPEIGRDEPVDFSDFEKEGLFQDWLREFVGINPDRMDDHNYWSTFETFKFHMFGSRGETPPNAGRAPEARPDAQEETSGSRLKDLYRLLVRRLHPDLRADRDAAVSSLWHEVQEAYAAGNIDRLETLLALSDIESGNLGADTTLFQMRALLQELKTALRNLQRSLRAARDDDAWDFLHRGGEKALRLRLQQELEIELAAQTDKLRILNNIIADLSRPPRQAARRKASATHPRFAF
jgi:hypothetical protein